MKARAACLFASALVVISCEEKKEITITETRPATTRDEKPKLFATSDERFREPSPVKADTPEGWLALPSTQMRLLNYRFGESGMGEVWISMSGGSVLDNVNRWLGQFEAAPLAQADVAKLPAVSIAGTTGVWVTAAGDYNPGMGGDLKPGFALAGVIAEVGGQILTVKMVGPKSEVEAAKPALESYARGLRLAE